MTSFAEARRVRAERDPELAPEEYERVLAEHDSAFFGQSRFTLAVRRHG